MGTNRRHANVVNVEDIPKEEMGQGGFGLRRRRIGVEAGTRALGCSHLEVPPGKTAYPFHFHSAHEEALYILEGTGTVRIGEDRVEVRAGDYVGFPAGPQFAHALTNTGEVPLRYLALSAPATPTTMDIVGYPDSKKVAFASGVDPVKGFRGGAWVISSSKRTSLPSAITTTSRWPRPERLARHHSRCALTLTGALRFASAGAGARPRSRWPSRRCKRRGPGSRPRARWRRPWRRASNRRARD